MPIRQCFLKTLAQRADATFVADTNLFPDEAGFTPRPAWQVIEAARRRYLTGELTLATSPTTKIFMRDGQVYFAERSSDGALPIRLMMEGVITREQMQRGTVIVNGVEHVGRMFEADPTIDRPSVELCTELFTDDVMVTVANTVVSGYELALYRRHPSGIDRWYPHSVPVASRQSDPASGSGPKRSPDAEATQKSADAKPKPQPPVKAEVKTDVKAESKNKLNAPPITQAVPVTASVGATPPPPPPTTQVAVTTQLPITTSMPVTAAQVKQMPAPTAQIPVTAPPASASSEIDATAIADEVAEAIKRAFAGTGAGF